MQAHTSSTYLVFRPEALKLFEVRRALTGLPAEYQQAKKIISEEDLAGYLNCQREDIAPLMRGIRESLGRPRPQHAPPIRSRREAGYAVMFLQQALVPVTLQTRGPQHSLVDFMMSLAASDVLICPQAELPAKLKAGAASRIVVIDKATNPPDWLLGVPASIAVEFKDLQMIESKQLAGAGRA